MRNTKKFSEDFVYYTTMFFTTAAVLILIYLALR
jgi:hypothetical protein